MRTNGSAYTEERAALKLLEKSWLRPVGAVGIRCLALECDIAARCSTAQFARIVGSGKVDMRVDPGVWVEFSVLGIRVLIDGNLLDIFSISLPLAYDETQISPTPER